MTLHSKLASSKGCYANGEGACISNDNKYIINIGYEHPYGFISVYNIEDGKEIRYREGMQEVYSNIQYIPSRQLYFIDGYRRLVSGKTNISICGSILRNNRLGKHSAIWRMQIFFTQSH